MSTRRDDDSRPTGNATSQRNTARDVPAAKFKEGSVGTVAPRGLRGPSLLPGQGAPERIVPEDVELAVLRNAETLDGPRVARAAAKRLPDPRSPSPTPVSVEVPRVRSVPPSLEEQQSTPSPSARSIQSGTLMSIGSVDPRAPTELSLPSPRPLSVSERAAYLGPEAVVDRTPVHSPRELPGVAESQRSGGATERPGSPVSEPLPYSSERNRAIDSGTISSARPSPKADSLSPPAQNFARAPRSYSPVSPGSAHSPPSPLNSARSRPAHSARSGPQSGPDAAPQFQIHSELDAVPREYHDDPFDLRSASTQREPLASRKPQPSTDWTAHGPISEPASRESRPGPRSSRHSSTAVTMLVDRGRDTAPPTTDRVASQRASVPLSWVLGSAAFALLLVLLMAWVLRSSRPEEAARPVDSRASAAAPGTAALPAVPEAVPPAAVRNVEPRPSSAGTAAVSAPHAATPLPKAAASASARPPASAAQPVPAADSNSKVRQSIY